VGSHMAVWGGEGPGLQRLGSGGAYDPVSDAWTSIAATQSLGVESLPESAALNDSIFLWESGRSAMWSEHALGWRTLSQDSGLGPLVGPAIAGGPGLVAVWDGVGGALYMEATDAWVPMNREGAPSPRDLESATWIGAGLFIFGGLNSRVLLNDGAIFGL